MIPSDDLLARWHDDASRLSVEGDAYWRIRILIQEVRRLRLELATVQDEVDVLRYAQELAMGRAQRAEHRIAEVGRLTLPAMDLLRAFASGEGGRRSGDLMRRGWIRVEITEAGRRALEGGA